MGHDLARRKFGGLGEVEHLHLAYLSWLSGQGERHPILDQHRLYHDELTSIVVAQGDRCTDPDCFSSLRDATQLGCYTDNTSKSCGAVMRVAPIGLLYHRDPFRAFETAVSAARLTHGHPTGDLAAGAFAMMIAWVTQGLSFSAAVQNSMTYLRSQPGHEEVLSAIINAPWPSVNRTKRPEWFGFGWTGEEALAIAIDAVLTTHTLEEAVIKAANHDGDSGTTASMAGNLAGALYGCDAVPARWSNRVEMRDPIVTMAVRIWC